MFGSIETALSISSLDFEDIIPRPSSALTTIFINAMYTKNPIITKTKAENASDDYIDLFIQYEVLFDKEIVQIEDSLHLKHIPTRERFIFHNNFPGYRKYNNALNDVKKALLEVVIPHRAGHNPRGYNIRSEFRSNSSSIFVKRSAFKELLVKALLAGNITNANKILSDANENHKLISGTGLNAHLLMSRTLYIKKMQNTVKIIIQFAKIYKDIISKDLSIRKTEKELSKALAKFKKSDIYNVEKFDSVGLMLKKMFGTKKIEIKLKKKTIKNLLNIIETYIITAKNISNKYSDPNTIYTGHFDDTNIKHYKQNAKYAKEVLENIADTILFNFVKISDTDYAKKVFNINLKEDLKALLAGDVTVSDIITKFSKIKEYINSLDVETISYLANYDDAFFKLSKFAFNSDKRNFTDFNHYLPFMLFNKAYNTDYSAFIAKFGDELASKIAKDTYANVVLFTDKGNNLTNAFNRKKPTLTGIANTIVESVTSGVKLNAVANYILKEGNINGNIKLVNLFSRIIKENFFDLMYKDIKSVVQNESYDISAREIEIFKNVFETNETIIQLKKIFKDLNLDDIKSNITKARLEFEQELEKKYEVIVLDKFILCTGVKSTYQIEDNDDETVNEYFGLGNYKKKELQEKFKFNCENVEPVILECTDLERREYFNKRNQPLNFNLPDNALNYTDIDVAKLYEDLESVKYYLVNGNIESALKAYRKNITSSDYEMMKKALDILDNFKIITNPYENIKDTDENVDKKRYINILFYVTVNIAIVTSKQINMVPTKITELDKMVVAANNNFYKDVYIADIIGTAPVNNIDTIISTNDIIGTAPINKAYQISEPAFHIQQLRRRI